jgi:hypothetical protein
MPCLLLSARLQQIRMEIDCLNPVRATEQD